jgi:transcriptional regulator with XRE-family HTH domain
VNRFTYLRKDHRVPFYRLSELSGIGEYFLSLVEKGRAVPTADQAARIGRALGLPDATPEKLLEEVVPATVAR